jgi:hypothetical protein
VHCTHINVASIHRSHIWLEQLLEHFAGHGH